jgi:hypothetical protein
MIDRNTSWVNKVNEIKKICASASLPIDVEKDTSPYGIDAVMELDDIPFEKTGDVYDVDFNIHLEYSITKNKWAELLSKLQVLSQKLAVDTTHTFTGWERIDDDSKLIYEGTVIIKGLVNPDILSS